MEPQSFTFPSSASTDSPRRPPVLEGGCGQGGGRGAGRAGGRVPGEGGAGERPRPAGGRGKLAAFVLCLTFFFVLFVLE